LPNQSEQADAIRQLLEAADDITDELEEAVFHLTLLKAETLEEEIRLPLANLARLLVEGTQEYLKAIENARGIHRSGSAGGHARFSRVDSRITVIEQESDTTERAVRKALVNSTEDYRQGLRHHRMRKEAGVGRRCADAYRNDPARSDTWTDYGKLNV